MKKNYKVAGHLFSIEASSDAFFWNKTEENYGPFETHESGRSVFSLSVCEDLDITERALVFSNKDSVEEGFITINIYNTDNGYFFEFIQPYSRQINGRLFINTGTRSAKISLSGTKAEQFNTLNTAANFCFMVATSDSDTLLAHSSTVIYKGKAYMFLGKSGTGKSTHSRMWLNAIDGVELLNDDHPVIRIGNDGTATAYGSPWSGKTACYKNLQAPIGGIIRISRALYNRARRLSPIESYASIMPSCPNLVWEKRFANEKHNTLQRIIGSVPCWVMECLPEEEAARVCCKAVVRE